MASPASDRPRLSVASPMVMAAPRPMEANMLLDTSFDFRVDTPKGKDPDKHSPTLRRYHQAGTV